MIALGQVTGEVQDSREFSVYGATTGSPTVSNTKKYTGGYAIRYTINSKAAGVTFAPQTGVRCGAWLNHVGVSSISGKAWFFVLRGSSTNVAEVYWEYSTGNVVLAVGGAAVASISVSAAGLSNTDTWTHVGLCYVTGAPGSVTFYVNGLAVLTYSGTLSASVTEAYAGGTAGTNGWSQYAYFDDIYFDGGISTDSAPPADRFLFSLVDGDGASVEWTPTGASANYDCVNDAVPNDDTDYVIASSAGLTDLYTTANITVPTNYVIRGVIPLALAKATSAGPTVKLVASDGVNTDLVSDAKTPGTSYGYVWEYMPLAPDGEAWTESKVNAAQFGLESAGSYT